MKNTILLLFLFWFSAAVGQTQDTCKTTFSIIKGKYSGKNLYFQQSTDDKVKQVFLNGKQMATTINASVFELVLSEDLKPGQAFEVKLVYCDKGVVPYKLLNPDVIK